MKIALLDGFGRYSVYVAPVAEQLPPALENKRAGITRVLSVRSEVRDDSEGESALFVTLVLEDPAPDSDDGTWPIDDLLGLQDLVHKAILEVVPDLDMPWYVDFQPQTEDQIDPDDKSVPGY